MTRRKPSELIFFPLWFSLQLILPAFLYAGIDNNEVHIPHFFSQSINEQNAFDLRFSEGFMHFRDDGVSFNIIKKNSKAGDFINPYERKLRDELMTGEQVQIKFENCSERRSLNGIEPLASTTNYFLGNKSSMWKSDLQNFSALYYKNLYNNIDLKYYVIGKEVKYDYILSPGARIEDIVMNYSGIVSLEVNSNGALYIKTQLTELKDYLPKSYQVINGKEIPVKVEFHMVGKNSIGFKAGEYNHGYALIIDPALVYSTFVGGNSNDYQWVGGIDRDASGNIYHTGRTFSSNFPTTFGAQQTVFGGNYDTYVFKLDPTGTTLIYSTFIGGAGQDGGYSVKVEQSTGNLWVVGATDSPTFPVTAGAFQTNLGGTGLTDAFVLKLNATGNAVLFSSLFGLAYSDYGHGIDIDNSGFVYITGETNGNAYTTPGAFQTSYGGGPWDGWIVKFDPTLSSVLYSTLFGGNREDVPISIKVDQNNDIFIAGFQNGGNMPTVAGSFDVTYNGGPWDAFVAKFNSTLSSVIYSTYLGSSGTDMIWNALQVNNAGEAIVAGFASSGFPTTGSAFQTTYGGGAQDVFVSKLNSSGTALVYSTLVGGPGNDQAYGLYLDASGEVYVTGSCQNNFPMTSCTYDSTFNGVSDAFIVKLSSDASQLLFSTYVGGASADIGYNITVLNNVIYVAGETQSADFPVSIASNDPTFNGSRDVFVLAMAASSSNVTANFNIPSSVCVNSPVQFNNSSVNAVSYLWDFGDGVTSTLQSPTHVYTTSAGRNVRLIAYATCASPDTFNLSIVVNDAPTASFSQIVNCNLTANFSDSGIGAVFYSWDFGDASSSTASSPSHTYSLAGMYDVLLIVSNAFGCTDSVQNTITTIQNPTSSFSVNTVACSDQVSVMNSSLNSTSYVWDFGDGAISSLNSPVHTYNDTGMFVITLISEQGVCTDTSFQSVRITRPPVASFSGQSGCNLTYDFLNTTTGAISSSWEFGDATSSSATSVLHTYATDGNYWVTLIVTNSSGCKDTVQNQIYLNPVPVSAFTFSPPQCTNTVSFQNTSANSSVVLWNFGDGNTTTDQTPIHQFSNPGLYPVMLIANPGQCADTSRQFIMINQVPRADFNSIASCDKVVAFSDLSNGTISSYLWDFGDATTSSAFSPSHAFPTSGVFSVKLVITDQNFCQDSVEKILSVNENPVAAFSFTPPVCSSSLTFRNNSSYGFSYLWDFGDGTVSTITWPTHYYLNAGVYTVRLIVDPFGCTDTIQQQVAIELPPLVDFSAESDCGLLSTFNNLSDSLNNYIWDFGDGAYNFTNSPKHQYTAPGIYNVSLIGINAIGCADTIFKEVNPLLFEEAKFITSFDTCSMTTVFEGYVTQSGNYNWEFGDGETANFQSVNHKYSASGTYSVLLVTNQGTACADTLAGVVEVPEAPIHGLFIPNCFTPNGDGLNEIFEVIDYNFCDQYTLSVFNRWGELIFESSDLNIGWDGTYNGTFVPEGVYTWLLKSNSAIKVGSVTVMK